MSGLEWTRARAVSALTPEDGGDSEVGAHSTESGHLFRENPATRSAAIRPADGAIRGSAERRWTSGQSVVVFGGVSSVVES